MGSEELVNDPKARTLFSQRLRSWYQKHRRLLPWRESRDPYAIFVSEVMLQQTQVATVLPYYARFLRHFPTVHELARAPETDVLRIWSGLGYYRRARFLQAAAKIVVQEFHGTFPNSVAQLMCLPGVGRYTACAVASFAYNIRAPVVEANSERVLRRVFAMGGLGSPLHKTRLWELATLLLPKRAVRDHNYAIMELGSLVCRPENPLCDVCPVVRWCNAWATGKPAQFGRTPPGPRAIKIRVLNVAVIHGCSVLLHRIPEGQWHAGLYEFPKKEISSTLSGESERHAVACFAAEASGTTVTECTSIRFLTSLRYSVTHHRIEARLWMVRLRSNNLPSKVHPGYFWISLHACDNLPLGSPHRRMLSHVRSALKETTGNDGRQEEKTDHTGTSR